MISVFDIFKIGIGPSSSHTVGPMRAAGRFVESLRHKHLFHHASRIETVLFGSLAWTGHGHATDTAVILGLAGEQPETIDPDAVPAIIADAAGEKMLSLGGRRAIAFDRPRDVVFDRKTPAKGHPNTLSFTAYDEHGKAMLTEYYFSVGGGFVLAEGEEAVAAAAVPVPHPFRSGADLLAIGRARGLSIAGIVLENETARLPEEEVRARLARIRAVMDAAIDRGMAQEGELPGGLRVKRRAKALHDRLKADRGRNVRAAHQVMDWVSLFAIAVNEENAAGGRVVTAPTNGAAGIVPAVLRYYREFCDASEAGADDFLLTAAAIGTLFKLNASISGAEVGCQGEVGVAASMAAAGLAAALGGSNEQIENAAEIGMEHHLGMTCDPIGGLVQIPCIERNAFGANKAIAAASLALHGDGTHKVSLDQVVATMRATGADMQSKYKETSQGGLAVNAVEC
ncbi:L-serine ammonia-lyase [Labrys wisconsinensis]|uniref:L-serine dehydratase n=1 Tax=Labrys wisconsinensis TaxID=425677 RepID=A0ABU0JB94_9HYPH|nr:L-serine ammonia-lyase [Labrys wisconsinensis]MDQ0471546.1 L-serine dehydratase [Labrys wisconsinensis]